MLKLIDLLGMLLLAAVTVSFLSQLLGRRFEGGLCRFWQAAGVLGFTGLLWMRLSAGRIGLVTWLSAAAFLFIWACLALEQGPEEKLCASLLSVSVIALSLCLGALLIGFVSGSGYYEILLRMTIQHYALLILVNLILFYTARVAVRLTDGSSGFGVRDFTFLLIIPVIAVIALFTLLNLVPAVAADTGMVQLVLILLASITVITLLSYYFYIELGREYKKKAIEKGLTCSLSFGVNDTKEFREEQIGFVHTVKKLSINGYKLPAMDIKVNYNRIGNVLIGLDILKLFDFHCGRSVVDDAKDGICKAVIRHWIGNGNFEDIYPATGDETHFCRRLN